MASADESTIVENGIKLNVNADGLRRAWDSSFMKSVREDMILGKEIPACSECYRTERNGVMSYRQYFTNEWNQLLGDELFEELINDTDGSLNISPLYLDLRLGNLCNLKCRMCNPFSSTQIVEEVKELWDDPVFRKTWQDEYDNDFDSLQSYAWSNDPSFWEQMSALAPDLRHVYMTGGEPTLIENNYRFLSYCVDKGYSSNLQISFNTNCTNVTSRFINLISAFKKVTINASIDAVGSANDYIRHPSKWSKIDQNFRKLVKCSNVRVNVSTVAQIFNAMEHVRLLEYLAMLEDQHHREIPISYSILTKPSHLDMLILPDGVRQTAIDMLEQHLLLDGRYTQAVDGLIKAMSQPRLPNHAVLLDRFAKMTRILDSKRKNRFEKIFPYLQIIVDNEK